MSDPFLGQIQSFAFSYTIDGWLPCNGTNLTINQNQALFAVIGATYGGNGTTNFNLPDLRGRTMTGYGPAAIQNNVITTARNCGTYFGVETESLSSAQLPAHIHAVAGTVNVTISGATPPTVTLKATTLDPASPGYTSVPANNSVLGATSDPGTGTPPTLYAPAGAAADVTLSGLSVTAGNPGSGSGSFSVNSAVAGSSLPINVIQPSLAINFLIANSGIFPMRP